MRSATTGGRRHGATVANGTEDGCGPPPMESSASTTEGTEKYDKNRRRKRRREKAKKKQSTGQIVALAGLFAAILLFWHFGIRVRRDRERDTHNRYARAAAILQSMEQNNRFHKNRRHPHEEGHEQADKADDANPRQAALREAMESTEGLQGLFEEHRSSGQAMTRLIPKVLRAWMQKVNDEVNSNLHGGIRWIRPYLLPGMDKLKPPNREEMKEIQSERRNRPEFFAVEWGAARMKWMDDYDALVQEHGGKEGLPGPVVDYTDPDKYQYPDLLEEPPAHGGYPHMTPLGEMMEAWDQDSDKKGTVTETLLHFDYSNATELAMAAQFRDSFLPFKLYNVPELARANELWTDEYLSDGFASNTNGPWGGARGQVKVRGMAQESVNHFFAFFTPQKWSLNRMGIPPTRDNDWDFDQWAKHAHYADAVGLSTDQPHFYFQAGVTAEERHQPENLWGFVTRDLPTFSATDENFVLFNPESQKGIQCRFGERGVVAATHYDAGRNMVGMITGAKRYILSPPKACSKLGIFPSKKSPIYRHSLLNFGHIKYLKDPSVSAGMSDAEREWLERAATAPAVETVLKAGEILYIPSFWFHYIISVQKSAQCNVRSGVEEEQHFEFGGLKDTEECRSQ